MGWEHLEGDIILLLKSGDRKKLRESLMSQLILSKFLWHSKKPNETHTKDKGSPASGISLERMKLAQVSVLWDPIHNTDHKG